MLFFKKNINNKNLSNGRLENYKGEILDGMAEGFQLINFDWKYVYVNDAVCKQGKKNKEELLGHTMMEVYPGIEKTEMFLTIKECLKKNISKKIENEFIYSDGSKGWFELSINPVSNGFYILSQDITKRKKTEADLSRVNKSLRMVSYVNQLLVYVENEKELLDKVCETIVDAGDYKMAWVGFAEQDELKTVTPVAKAGTGCEYLKTANIVWADTENGHGPTGNAIRSGEIQICNDIVNDPRMAPWKDQAIKCGYRSSVAVPLKSNGQSFGALNVYSEKENAFSNSEVKILEELAGDLAFGIVSQRIRAEREIMDKKLEELEYKYKTVVEGSNDGIIIIQDFKIKFANKKIFDLMNYNEEEVFGKEFLSFISEDSKERIKSNYIARMLGKKVQTSYKVDLIKKNGESIPVEVSGSIIDFDGKKADLAVIRDITEREKSEKELKKIRSRSQIFLDSIVENVPNMIFVKDAKDLKFVLFNKAGEDLLGYSKEMMLGKNDYDFFPKKQADFFIKKDREVLNSKKLVEIVKESINTKNKGERFLHTYKVPILDGNGNPLYLLGISEDITESIALKELTQYKFIFEQSNQQLAMADMDGKLIIVNQSHAKNHGYKIEELIGKNLSVLHPEEEMANVRDALKKLKEKGRDKREVVHLRKDGSTYVTMMDNFILKMDDKQKYLIGMALDITQIKEAEKNINAQKSLLDSIIKSVDEALLVIDINGKVEFSNDRFNVLWNIPEQLIKNKDDKKLLDYVVGQLTDPKSFIDRINYLYAHPEEDDNALINFKDGRVFARYSTSQKIGNSIVGRVWCFRDITKEKEIEKAKTEFVSLASHQLRTPSTAIKWYSEMLFDKKNGDLNEKQQRYLNEIYRGNERMIKLINNLLSVSRIEMGQSLPKKEKINIDKLLKEIVREQEPEITKKMHSIVIKKSKDLLNISSDYMFLKMILQNFISNSIKYTHNNGKIKFNAKKTTSKIIFSVEDNGIGIPQDEQKKICDKFFRASNSLILDREGNGLGLYISKEIAKLLGGKISFHSSEGKGTIFSLELPIK